MMSLCPDRVDERTPLKEIAPLLAVSGIAVCSTRHVLRGAVSFDFTIGGQAASMATIIEGLYPSFPRLLNGKAAQ